MSAVYCRYCILIMDWGSTMTSPVPEVLGTFIAGEELGEEVDELPHLPLLRLGGPVGVIRRHGVEERPGVASQLSPVQRTLRVLLRPAPWLGLLVVMG